MISTRGALSPALELVVLVVGFIGVLALASVSTARRDGEAGSLYASLRSRRGQQHRSAPLAHTYLPCPDVANGTSLFRVDSVRLDPERIARGSTATFRIGAAVPGAQGAQGAQGEVEGWPALSSELESGRVRMRVQYGGLTVYHEEDGICDLVDSCPGAGLPRDGEPFEIVYVKEFPYITPPGAYEVEIRGELGDGEESEESGDGEESGKSGKSGDAPISLFCVRVSFRVNFWGR